MEEKTTASLHESEDSNLENQKETKTFSLISMCVCRDAFWIGANDNNKYNYKVNSFWQNISPFSTYSNKINALQLLNPDEFSWGSPWQKKCINIDIQKNIIEQTITSSDYLIIDICHTSIKLAKWSEQENCFLTIDQPFVNNKDFILRVAKGSFESINPYSLSEDYINKSLNKYFEDIKNIFETKKIILCEFYCAKDYYCKVQQKISNYEAVFDVDNRNTFLKQLCQKFEDNLKGCHIIKMPDNALGLKQHRWGHHPLHFCDEFYDYALSAFDVIASELPIKDEIIILEKLRQQCSKTFSNKRKIIELTNTICCIKNNLEQQVNTLCEQLNTATKT